MAGRRRPLRRPPATLHAAAPVALAALATPATLALGLWALALTVLALRAGLRLGAGDAVVTVVLGGLALLVVPLYHLPGAASRGTRVGGRGGGSCDPIARPRPARRRV